MLLLLENVYVQLIVIFLCIFPESLYETWNSIEQHYFATLPLVYQNLRYERSMRTPMLLEVPNLIDFLKQVFICDEYHVEMLLFRVLKCSSVVIVCLQSKPSWVPTVRCSMFTILIFLLIFLFIVSGHRALLCSLVNNNNVFSWCLKSIMNLWIVYKILMVMHVFWGLSVGPFEPGSSVAKCYDGNFVQL